MASATRILLPSIAALITGLITFQIVVVLRTPALWGGEFAIRDNWLPSLVAFGAIYLAMPIAVLFVISLWRNRWLPISVCCGVPLVWAIGLFLNWAQKPWTYYHEFPWWMAERDLLVTAGTALVSGWTYWRLSRP